MKILITGITGQSGSYLAEKLLDQGHEVHGIVRRSSSFNRERIEHIRTKLNLHYGDITDALNIDNIISEIKPDRIYNLAAQSHVHISFQLPLYTTQTDGIGTLNILEAVKKHCPECRIYNATTSELYGKVQEIPQTEKTPFYPRSPYGVAKLYSFWISKNYREAYNMFISNGILFNHETLADFTPMIFKIDDEIDIKPISEIVKYHTNKNKLSIDINIQKYQETKVTNNLYVWDNNNWTKVKFASAYPHDIENDNKKPRFLISKKSSYLATSSHHCIMDDLSEKEFGDIKLGDKVNIINYPIISDKNIKLTNNEAELLGFITGDGNFNKKRNDLKIIGKKTIFLEKYSKIWEKLGGKVYKYQGISGFNNNEKVWHYNLNGNSEWKNKYLSDIYDEYNKKRIPKIILNSNKDTQLSFLKGYNNADGLKMNNCVYNFKNFRTNSHTLAAGLIFLLKNTTGQDYNINIEKQYKFGEEKLYYSINILSNSNKGQNHRNGFDNYKKVLELLNKGYSQRKIQRETNISRTFIRKIQNGYIPDNKHHLQIPDNSIKKIIEIPDYDGWFFDLETESGTFHAGVGQGHVHNSPRRGSNFVTKKITEGLVNWLKTNEPIHLGNIDASRDWGYAPEYCDAMIKIMEHDYADDFVIATGEGHTNREFIEEACKYIDVEIEWQGEGENEIGIDKESGEIVIVIDPKFFRPSDVNLLLGDPTKAKDILGWEPKTKFKDLIKIMMEFELKKYNK